MKNLKKALSMVLASAMLFGMMVVGTGAAHSDVKAEHNVEAIAVVSAAGIMGANEEFNPDAKITRNEMAVVMVNMLGLDAEDYAGASKFTDVPAWAADYVDACYANGIVSGVSATEFNGSANVTAAEAALMMQKALGYFQNAADFGQDWLLATIKNASKIDLLKGIDAKADAQLTRNEVAQLALNTLKANIVELDESATNTTITAGDVQVSISGNSNYDFVVAEGAHYETDYVFAQNEVDYVQLIEDLFEDITVEDTTDAYGREAIEWFNEDESIVVVADEADYVLVATKETTLKKLIKDNKLDKKIEIETEDEENIDLYIGQVVELWVEEKAIDEMVTYIYAESEITKVEELDEDIDEDAIKDGAKYEIELTAANGVKDTFLDIEFEGFNAKTYVKGAYVLFPVLMNGEVVVETVEFDELGDVDVMQDTAIAETFEGKVTAKGADYVKIGSTKYESTRFIPTMVVGEEYTFVKDVNGNVINAYEVEEKDETVAIDDVVYLVNTYDDGGKADKYGNITTTYYAQVMNLKGEVEDIEIAADCAAFEAGLYTVKTYTAKKDGAEVKAYAEDGSIETITMNVKKGQSVLNAWSDDDFAVVAPGAVTVESDDKKIGSIRTTSKMTYILVEGIEDEIETEVKAGKQNITLTATTLIIAEVDDDDNMIAAYVIVPNGEFDTTTEYDDVIYVEAADAADLEETFVTVDDDDVTVVVLNAYDENGKAIELVVDPENEENEALDASGNAVAGFYTFSKKDGIYTLTAIDAYVADDEAGYVTGAYTAKYGTEFTVNGVELETEGAVWVDLHDTDGIYKKAIKSLAALDKAESMDDLTVTVYADKNGNAKVIVVND